MKLHEIVGDKMPEKKYDNSNQIDNGSRGYNKCRDDFKAIDIPTANVDEINEAIYTEGLMPLPDFGRAIAEKYWLIPKEGK